MIQQILLLMGHLVTLPVTTTTTNNNNTFILSLSFERRMSRDVQRVVQLMLDYLNPMNLYSRKVVANLRTPHAYSLTVRS